MRPLAGLRHASQRRESLFAVKRAARYHANSLMAMVLADIFSRIYPPQDGCALFGGLAAAGL
jgi:hypothetical protein